MKHEEDRMPAGVLLSDGLAVTAPRVVCQFSCGAASAVATKLALAQHADRCIVVNAYIEEEHPDNRRFAADCERWFGVPIVNLRDTKYGASAIKVFETVGYIKGQHGAACTTRIKRGLLRTFEQPGDVLVLGYTAEEQGRYDDWLANWPDRRIIAPLIERGLTKEDCKAMVQRAGIKLPEMYLLGYDNANCIGCVKGGLGYFRAVREDFPAQFERLAQAEDKVSALHGEGAYILRHRSGPLAGKRFPLRELPAGKAHRGEPLPSCGLFCESAEQEYAA
jgi:3'-phosphoadenosine 5'-phosphosulfate sulfotransferase (PAPS reductase)/FAD synthetase